MAGVPSSTGFNNSNSGACDHMTGLLSLFLHAILPHSVLTDLTDRAA